MNKVLGSKFFDRPALTVAKELLGKYVVRKIGRKEIALMITEVEAYDGPKDQANHAHRGQTPRNTPMFDTAGTIYVYFTYGIHWMLNVVCGKKGYPAAILIRGAGDVVGPARLTKALSIDKSLNHKDLGEKAGLWIEDRGVKIPPRQIARTPRIGIGYAGEYALKPWRFVIKSEVNGTVRRAQKPRG